MDSHCLECFDEEGSGGGDLSLGDGIGDFVSRLKVIDLAVANPARSCESHHRSELEFLGYRRSDSQKRGGEQL